MSKKSTVAENGNKGVDYLMTHKSTEVERLAAQHAVLTDSMKALFFAPIDLNSPGLKILDLATANGIWLQDLQSSTNVSHTYIGTDIVSEMFPSRIPPSINLVLQSNTDPWPLDWLENFDFVHQRFALATSGQMPVKEVVNRMIQLIKPGGWIEFVEADMTGGPNSKGKAMAIFGDLAKFVFSALGVQNDFPFLLQGWLKEAGLENVTEEVFDVPIGAKNTNQQFCEKSIMNFQNVAVMFSSVAQNMPNLFDPQELNELPKNLVDELYQEGGFQRIHVVFGRKPM